MLWLLSLVDGVSTETFISGALPFETTTLHVGGKKVTHNPKQAILNSWGRNIARELYHDRWIINRLDFNFVYWDGVEKVAKSMPDMFRVWTTKHVSYFCATNCQLSRIDCTIPKMCALVVAAKMSLPLISPNALILELSWRKRNSRIIGII